MGRHRPAPAPRKNTALHRAWRRLPRDFRARVWEWRQRWWVFWDRVYAPRVRDWDDGRQWEERLPKDPWRWTYELQRVPSPVAAALRRQYRQRGDLLPDHHQEKS